MRRLRKSRLMHALVTLVWCGSVAARPVAMPCPMGGHGAMPQTAERPSPAESPMRHSAHSGMVGNRGVPSSSVPDVPENSEHSHHACDCIAHCCATGAVIHRTDAPTIAASEADGKAPGLRTYANYTPAWVDYVLPFAMAPPVSAHT